MKNINSVDMEIEMDDRKVIETVARNIYNRINDIWPSIGWDDCKLQDYWKNIASIAYESFSSEITELLKQSEMNGRLIIENAKLREALRPFAYYANQIPDDISDTASASGTVGDLRAAVAAIRGTGINDGIGLVSMPHPEGMTEMAAEILCLRAENEKLMSAYKNGYHNALEAAAELSGKILMNIEGIDFEVPNKIRQLHASSEFKIK